MNIPPKYEDVVAQLDSALGRESALREELESIKASVDGYDSPEHAAQVADEMGHQCNTLQQRLTVAEQRADELEGLLFGDILEAMDDFGDRHDLKRCREIAKDIRALKPVEEGEWS